MGSSVMWPLTLGAMPTKLARTVAASVSGRLSHRQTVKTIATMAPTRMIAPTVRPVARRSGEGCSVYAVGSATEHALPDDEGEKNHQRDIHESSWPKVGVDAQAREEPPEEDGSENAKHQRRHPGREVRAGHGDVRGRPAAREEAGSDDQDTRGQASPGTHQGPAPLRGPHGLPVGTLG